MNTARTIQLTVQLHSIDLDSSPWLMDAYAVMAHDGAAVNLLAAVVFPCQELELLVDIFGKSIGSQKH